MSKLVWDQTGKKFYETGVSKTVLFPQKADGSYDDGVAWSGVTNITLSPDGAEPNELYADNIKYAVLRSAETLGMTIEAYTYPDEWARCDGSYTPEGVKGVFIGQQPRQAFGICFRSEIGSDTMTDANAGYKLHIVWNATASPSDRAYDTINDSPDAQTMSWECDTTAVNINLTGYKPVCSIELDTTRMDATTLANLAKLEEYLYGTDAVEADPENQIEASEGTAARLLTPDQVVNVMKTGELA